MKRKFKEVEEEFPGDTALQQIHIARKILQEEAKKKKMELWEYIRFALKDKENYLKSNSFEKNR